MNEVPDCRGVAIRITAERLAHVLEHPEMVGLEAAIATTLASPEVVIRSRTDSRVELYYRFYPGTRVGDKYLCVVVRFAPEDAFMLTAYLTNRPKEGEVLWRRK